MIRQGIRQILWEKNEIINLSIDEADVISPFQQRSNSNRVSGRFFFFPKLIRCSGLSYSPGKTFFIREYLRFSFLLLIFLDYYLVFRNDFYY